MSETQNNNSLFPVQST